MVEYVGEVITNEEAEERGKKYGKYCILDMLGFSPHNEVISIYVL